MQVNMHTDFVVFFSIITDQGTRFINSSQISAHLSRENNSIFINFLLQSLTLLCPGLTTTKGIGIPMPLLQPP